MERTIHNLNEWTEEELYNLENLICEELDRRIEEREEEIKDKVRTALLEYADFLASNNFSQTIGYTSDNDLREVPVELHEIINWFCPTYY